jgi:hypothetical protein
VQVAQLVEHLIQQVVNFYDYFTSKILTVGGSSPPLHSTFILKLKKMEKLKVSQNVVDFVHKSILFVKENNKDLNMNAVIANFDYENNCGTTCCLYGWLPAWNSEFSWIAGSVVPNFQSFFSNFSKDEYTFLNLNFSVYLWSHEYPFLENLPFDQQTAETIKEVEERFNILMDYVEII